MAVFREDPYPAGNFLVEIEGGPDGASAEAQFSEVSGLGVEVGVAEYRAGNEKTGGVRKLAGTVRYSNVVLERGVVGHLGLWEWIKAAIDGAPDKRSVVVRLLNEDREPVLIWKLTNAWPCGYRGPRLHADGKSVALERLELCHEGMTLE